MNSSISKIPFSKGEILCLILLAEIVEYLQNLDLPKITKEEKLDNYFDPKILKKLILDGNFWFFDHDFKFKKIFGELKLQDSIFKDDPIILEVSSMLEMWEILERSIETLSKKERYLLSKKLNVNIEDLFFDGFDYNYDGNYYEIANVLIKYGGFFRFKGRKFKEIDCSNGIVMANNPDNIENYRKMLFRFNEIKNKNNEGDFYFNSDLSLDQLIYIYSFYE